MQKAIYKTTFSKQRGVTMIEVLISIFIMAIIGLGSAFIAGRTVVLHRDQNVHLHTINQMRNQLESSQCITADTKVITVAEQNINLDCTYTEGSYTVAAYNSSGAGVASTTNGAIKVKYPALKVTETDTFVPIKVEINP